MEVGVWGVVSPVSKRAITRSESEESEMRIIVLKTSIKIPAHSELVLYNCCLYFY